MSYLGSNEHWAVERTKDGWIYARTLAWTRREAIRIFVDEIWRGRLSWRAERRAGRVRCIKVTIVPTPELDECPGLL